jgi:hypothetical protein
MKISFEMVNMGREIPRTNKSVPSVNAHHRIIGLSSRDDNVEKIFFIGDECQLKPAIIP